MRETNTAVNRLASKPKVKVTANPLTGTSSEQEQDGSRYDRGDVRIHDRDPACAKPCSTARTASSRSGVPPECAQKISTFRVHRPCPRSGSRRNTGRVSVAPKYPIKPNRMIRFRISAKSALMPASAVVDQHENQYGEHANIGRRTPARMESVPSDGPTVRFFQILDAAGRAPEFRVSARSLAPVHSSHHH